MCACAGCQGYPLDLGVGHGFCRPYACVAARTGSGMSSVDSGRDSGRDGVRETERHTHTERRSAGNSSVSFPGACYALIGQARRQVGRAGALTSTRLLSAKLEIRSWAATEHLLRSNVFFLSLSLFLVLMRVA